MSKETRDRGEMIEIIIEELLEVTTIEANLAEEDMAEMTGEVDGVATTGIIGEVDIEEVEDTEETIDSRMTTVEMSTIHDSTTKTAAESANLTTAKCEENEEASAGEERMETARDPDPQSDIQSSMMIKVIGQIDSIGDQVLRFDLETHLR